MKTDEEIRKSVIEEITWDPQLSNIATQIGVGVHNEVVTLSGNVESYAQKIAAEAAAERVSGVKVVAVDIEVKSGDVKGTVSDTEIALRVRNALTWHSAVNEDLVNIKVDDGIVHLEGIVNWDYERKAAERAVSNLLGVKGVVNNIRINKKRVEPAEVKRKIRDAFHRHATVDSNNISVNVSESTVTLTGKVRTREEWRDAEEVVWSMPGITEVINQLEVDSAILAE